MTDTERLDVSQLTTLTYDALSKMGENRETMDVELEKAVDYTLIKCAVEAKAGKTRMHQMYRAQDAPFDINQCKKIRDGLRRILKTMGFKSVLVKGLHEADSIGIRVAWPQSHDADAKTPVSNLKLGCPVCYESKPANILTPCGHHVCNDCGKWTGKSCPICNSLVQTEQSVYSAV